MQLDAYNLLIYSYSYIHINLKQELKTVKEVNSEKHTKVYDMYMAV